MFRLHLVLPSLIVYAMNLQKKEKKENIQTQVATTMVTPFVYVWLNVTSRMLCVWVQFPLYPLGVRIGNYFDLLGRKAFCCCYCLNLSARLELRGTVDGLLQTGLILTFDFVSDDLNLPPHLYA